MRLSEIKVPSQPEIRQLAKLLAEPIDVIRAREEILPLLNTPLLNDLLDSLESDGGDVNISIIKYLDAEYPTVSSSFKDYPMKRDDNIDGQLSPLGHKDEDIN